MSNYYPPVPAEEVIAEARRMSVREVRQQAFEQRRNRETGGTREARNTGVTDAEHLRNLAVAKDLQARFGHEPSKPVAQRSAAINRSTATDETRFNEWLARPEHSRAYDDRAAAEGTGSAGGYLVPPRFSQSLIHFLREYDGLLKNFELWESPHGEGTVRPVYAAFGAAVADTENTSFTDGPYPTLNQQIWGQAPIYAASFTASRQLVQDAFIESQNRIGAGFDADSYLKQDAMGATSGGWPQSAPVENNIANRTLDQWVSAALGESMGRAIAPVAQSALYAGITAVGTTSGGAGGYLPLSAGNPVYFGTGSSTELSSGTIALDTAGQLVECLDAAYLGSPNCAWYMSPAAWGGIIRQTDAASSKKLQIDASSARRRLYDMPVILTSQTTAPTASSVSGIVLGDLSAAMTLRVVGGSMTLLRSHERKAELLAMYYRASLRVDAQVRDSRAMVGVRYAAT